MKSLFVCSMARSFQRNFVLANSASSSAWQLLCSWDFSINTEKAVRLRKKNLRVQLKVFKTLQSANKLHKKLCVNTDCVKLWTGLRVSKLSNLKERKTGILSFDQQGTPKLVAKSRKEIHEKKKCF